MPKIKVENLYRTTITSSLGIASSGDVNFTVTTAPINSNGFIVISPDSTTLREIMYYHDVIGNTIYVRAENRISPKAHSKNELVQINDIAEIFNTYSDMISTCFYAEKTGGLNMKIWGGTVYYNGSPQTVADTNITLVDNTTNYVKYDFATNTISVDQINSGNIKITIVTLSGIINSINYNVSKESLATQGVQGEVGPTGGTAPIDDTTPSLTSLYSSQKTQSLVDNVGGSGGAGSNIYLTSLTSSTDGAYKQLSYTADLAETIISGVVNNNEVLVNTYIFDADVGVTLIDAGDWIFHYHAYTSSVAQESYVRFVPFKRTSGGTVTDLFSYTTEDINSTTAVERTNHTTQPSYAVNATDRIGVKVYVSTTRTNNTTISVIVGDGNSSYINSPLALRHNNLRARDAVDSHPISAISLLTERLILPEGFMSNGKIVPSVTGGNLTVAIKTLAGTNPSATDPVYTRVNNAIRTITSACTITINNNDFYNFNSGSAELATKEVDYFVYLSTFGGPLVSRCSHFGLVSEGVGGGEKTIANTGGFSTESINVIGRFTAIKASGATGNWSVPTLTSSNLIQRPIYETRILNYIPVFTGLTAQPTLDYAFYKIVGNLLFLDIRSQAGTSNSIAFTATSPFSAGQSKATESCRILDNGTWVSGGGSTEMSTSSNIVNYYTGMNGGVFTASGSKATISKMNYYI